MKDEDAFFEWVYKIKSIIKIEGIGTELYLYCKNKNISRIDLKEIISLFYRYNIDMKQLKIFLNAKNKDWFNNSEKYWYKKVFDN